MFDMGPYYLTALVNMLGPIKRITGSARITHPTRTITSQPKYGKVIEVETPTHIAGVMDFASGVVGTIITSFDIHGSTLPCIEIYGTRGTMIVPDPNGFGGAVRIKRAGSPDWMEIPLSHGFADNSRGIGVADMAAALQSGRKHRANGDLAFHVLDAMESFLDASSQNRHIELETTCERPEPLPLGLPKDSVEL
jgi:predicted dehydrogenase